MVLPAEHADTALGTHSSLGSEYKHNHFGKHMLLPFPRSEFESSTGSIPLIWTI